MQTDSAPRGNGNIVIGIMLVLIGAAVMADRAGFVGWPGRLSLWPVIFIGIGLARFVQSVPGQPRRGTLFLAAGAWLLLQEAGVLSFQDWPLLLIALGIVVALNSGMRRAAQPPGAGTPAPGRPLAPLAVFGIAVAMVLALQSGGFGGILGRDATRVFSVMGRSEHTSRSESLQRADVTSIMGRSVLDLRDASISRGARPVINVVTLMGTTEIRVPSDWVVDTRTLALMGRVRDQRSGPASFDDAPASSRPRVIVRGLVLMGRVVITS